MDSSKYLSEGTQNNSLVWVDTSKEVESKLINKIIVQSLQNVMREPEQYEAMKRILEVKLTDFSDFCRLNWVMILTFGVKFNKMS